MADKFYRKQRRTPRKIGNIGSELFYLEGWLNVAVCEQDMLLLDAMREGSAEAFDRFYERYMPLVYRIAYRMTGDRMEAEDLCHDVFLEAFDKARQFDPARGSLESWLAVRTKCRALDRLRRTSRVRTEEAPEERLGDARQENTTEERVLGRLDRETLLNALERIPASQRTAVYGMYYEMRTQKELSESMARPLGTIKSLVRYGLNNLRKQLGAAERGESSGGERR